MVQTYGRLANLATDVSPPQSLAGVLYWPTMVGLVQRVTGRRRVLYRCMGPRLNLLTVEKDFRAEEERRQAPAESRSDFTSPSTDPWATLVMYQRNEEGRPVPAGRGTPVMTMYTWAELSDPLAVYLPRGAE